MNKFTMLSTAAVLALALTACGTSNAPAASDSAAPTSEAMSEAMSEAATSEAAMSEESSELTGPQTAEYTFYNSTGEKVTELYHYVNGGDKGKNLAGDAGLDMGASVKETIEIDAKEIEAFVSTVEYKTESGREGKFETLHFETVPVNLLAEDAMTGATPLEFKEPAAK